MYCCVTIDLFIPKEQLSPDRTAVASWNSSKEMSGKSERSVEPYTECPASVAVRSHTHTHRSV